MYNIVESIVAMKVPKNLPAGHYYVKDPSPAAGPLGYLVVKAFSPERARELILECGQRGRVFYVHFIKRSTGEERKMVCRLGVNKGVKGVLKPGERKAEDAATDNITVFEMGVGFKRIPLDAVIYVSGRMADKKTRVQKGGRGSSPGKKAVVEGSRMARSKKILRAHGRNRRA